MQRSSNCASVLALHRLTLANYGKRSLGARFPDHPSRHTRSVIRDEAVKAQR